ncbi:hypothetical protein [Bradyrhizobium lablabi]|uniref:hypothetical protein n=1 Tax=Bradyrhizobium lablabi TaxID=722472 RepID=UPI0032E41230
MIYQRFKPRAETVLCGTKATPKVVESGHAGQSIANDEKRPPVADDVKTSGNRALVLSQTLAAHSIISMPASAAMNPVRVPRASFQSRYQRIDCDSDETVALQRLQCVGERPGVHHCEIRREALRSAVQLHPLPLQGPAT